MNNSSNPGRPEGPDGVKTLERMNSEHAPLREFGFSNIEFKPGMRILDVGCGGGMTIAEMLKLSQGSIIDGIDYSPTSVERSKDWGTHEMDPQSTVGITSAVAANVQTVRRRTMSLMVPSSQANPPTRRSPAQITINVPDTAKTDIWVPIKATPKPAVVAVTAA